MKKITPHLWFDKQAKEAAEFYAATFPDSKITNVTTLSGTPSGDCDIVSFALAGQPFMAISAGPVFQFNPSISFHVKCSTKEEVNTIWDRLSEGAKVLMPLASYPFSERYGWLEDRYGLSWQVIQTDGDSARQKLMPALMFVGEVCGRAEEAINFYESVFANSPHGVSLGETNANAVARYGKGEEPNQEGTVRYAQCALAGQEFGVMDSAHSHKFSFNEAISFTVPCDTQDEIDYFWGKLSADPAAERCGWLKDKFGVSWQITPANLQEFFGSNDKERAKRVTQSFLKMKKFDLAALQRAASGLEPTAR